MNNLLLWGRNMIGHFLLWLLVPIRKSLCIVNLFTKWLKIYMYLKMLMSSVKICHKSNVFRRAVSRQILKILFGFQPFNPIKSAIVSTGISYYQLYCFHGHFALEIMMIFCKIRLWVLHSIWEHFQMLLCEMLKLQNGIILLKN